MDYNSPENLAACYYYVEQALKLLYYSHIPAAVLSILIGLFVLIKNKGSLVSRLLFAIALSFSLWTLADLIVWLNYDKNTLMMFTWAFFGILYVLIYIFSLYFVYVFIDKKDISLRKKIFLGFLLFPIILLTPTKFNLESFSTVDCIAVEGKYFTNYYYFVGLIIFFWIIALAIQRYKKAEKESKKQIILLTIGIGFFLLSFFISGFLASYLIDAGYIAGGNYGLEQYGLFGMPIFMGFLAYLIVKFKAFEIKLIGAQALVVALIILVGSQFTFIVSATNKILTAITLAIAVIFGWILVRSVKKEVKQREELEIANTEIEKRNEAIVERNEKLKVANKEITKRKNQLQRMADSLAIANDKLQKLDTAKTDFISMASHQLRTPPTPIKGYSSMLLEGSYGELNDEQRKAVENIYNANNQQITFVEDLLAVSRIESGSMKFVFAKCQIGDLCQEVVNNLILKAKANGLYLDYTAPNPPLPELAIDGNKVREVISNLVDNALKYTPRGGVTLLTELCEKKDQNCLKKPHLRITVSDTGIGIPAEEIPYLFHKFSRGKDISRLNTGGTGLGLYVAKIITEANGGNIWIESPGAGRGSKFIIELPLDQTQETIERNG